jgi:hypothetical protein
MSIVGFILYFRCILGDVVRYYATERTANQATDKLLAMQGHITERSIVDSDHQIRCNYKAIITRLIKRASDKSPERNREPKRSLGTPHGTFTPPAAALPESSTCKIRYEI